MLALILRKIQYDQSLLKLQFTELLFNAVTLLQNMANVSEAASNIDEQSDSKLLQSPKGSDNNNNNNGKRTSLLLQRRQKSRLIDETLAERGMEKGGEQIEIFTLQSFDNAILEDSKETEKKINEILTKSAQYKVRQRIFRVGLILCGLIYMIIALKVSNVNFDVTKILSLFLTASFVFYFCHVFTYILTAKNAYRIYSLNGMVDNGQWISMPITSRQLKYKYEPIESISELSAIGGGNANQVRYYTQCFM